MESRKMELSLEELEQVNGVFGIINAASIIIIPNRAVSLVILLIFSVPPKILTYLRIYAKVQNDFIFPFLTRQPYCILFKVQYV